MHWTRLAEAYGWSVSTPPPPWNPGDRQPWGDPRPRPHPRLAAGWGTPPPPPGYPYSGPAWPQPSGNAPTPPPPPQDLSPRRTGLWVTAAVAVAVAAVLVVAFTVVSGGSPSSSTASIPTSGSTPAPATTDEAKPENHCEGAVATAGPASPPGWQHVISARGLVYDVPPDWTVESCGTLIGWESADCPDAACPSRTMSGAATSPPIGECVMAMSGVPGARDHDDIHDAVDAETRLVTGIYTTEDGVTPRVELDSPRDFTIDGRPAVEVIATITGRGQGSCGSHDAKHVMVATTVDGQPGSVMFVLAVYGEATPADLIDQMVGSLRLAPSA